MITDDDLNRWQALYDATTPGPWRVRCMGVQMDGTCTTWHVESVSVREWPDNRIFLPMGKPYREENARFAAAAHEALPALIAEVRRLRRAGLRLVWCAVCEEDRVMDASGHWVCGHDKED